MKWWALGIASAALILALVFRRQIQLLVIDQLSQQRIDGLHPKIRKAARQLLIDAEQAGIHLRITSGMRTWAEQQKLYDQGRTTPGKIVTNAKPGSSLHNYGLAIDVVEIKDGKALWTNPRWDEIGALGKKLGFAWGGDWTSIKDKPHFEMRFGLTTKELAARYTANLRDGEFVNIA